MMAALAHPLATLVTLALLGGGLWLCLSQLIGLFIWLDTAPDWGNERSEEDA